MHMFMSVWFWNWNDVCEFPCMRDDAVHVGEVCESKWSYGLEVPDDLIRPCGVFVLFYCHLDLCCGECYVGCLQF